MRVKSQYPIKTKIRLLILAEKESYPICKIAKHSLFSVFFYDYTCVMSTKTKCVAQCGTYSTLLSLIERKVQIIVDFRIIITFFVVNGWRYNIILYS